jgi:hypothetical protein
MRKITGLFLVLVIISSCDVYLESDTDQVTSITDASGVDITLEWTDALGSSSLGLDKIDLDLYLVLNGDTIQRSEETDAFETLEVSSHFVNLTYYVNIDYYAGDEIANFDIFVSGKNNPDNVIKIEGTIEQDTINAYGSVISILKNGDLYTIE